MSVGLVDNLIDDPLLLEAFLWMYARKKDTDMLKSVLYFFELNTKTIPMQTYIIHKEIQATCSLKHLMREDSANTFLMQLHLRHIGNRWLFNKLCYPIRKVLSSKSSVEIDPIRLDAKHSLKKNIENLCTFTSRILDDILSSVNDLPSPIIKLCYVLFKTTESKFPDGGYLAIANYLFLRFICPIISTPERINIAKDGAINSSTRRKLVLIAKVIQGIANNTTCCNESYMSAMTEFSNLYQPKMKLFLESVVQRGQMDCNVSPIISPKKRRSFLLRSSGGIDTSEFYEVKLEDYRIHENRLLGDLKGSLDLLENSFFEEFEAKEFELSRTRRRCQYITGRNSNSDEVESCHSTNEGCWNKILEYMGVHYEIEDNSPRPVSRERSSSVSMIMKRPTKVIKRMNSSLFKPVRSNSNPNHPVSPLRPEKIQSVHRTKSNNADIVNSGQFL